MDFVGIDKLSLLDYEDKVACVLFSKACNFACPFCHNGLTVLQSDETVPFREILDYLKLRKGVLDGVVISGGEPTLMPDLVEKIKAIREYGLEIKLDTNGSNPEVLEHLINNKLVDYVAMDIKNGPSNYYKTIGLKDFDIAPVKKSIDILMHSSIDFEFRTTLVNEFHTEKDIYEIGVLIKDAPKLYLQKFVEREGCLKKGLHEVESNIAIHFKEILSNYIKNVELRGY